MRRARSARGRPGATTVVGLAERHAGAGGNDQNRPARGRQRVRVEGDQPEARHVKAEFGDARRSEIVTVAEDISIEDLIAPQDMVVTFSHGGYAKAQPLDEYRAQLALYMNALARGTGAALVT